jgi:hypothetical protein
MVGERELIIGTASEKHPTQYQRVSRVALMHVTALEDLPLPAPSNGNGEQVLG